MALLWVKLEAILFCKSDVKRPHPSNWWFKFWPLLEVLLMALCRQYKKQYFNRLVAVVMSFDRTQHSATGSFQGQTMDHWFSTIGGQKSVQDRSSNFLPHSSAQFFIVHLLVPFDGRPESRDHAAVHDPELTLLLNLPPSKDEFVGDDKFSFVCTWSRLDCNEGSSASLW